MPSILIDVWTRLHKSSMESTDRDLQKQMQKAGRNAANAFATEMESANPRIRKAAAGILEANSKVAQSNKLLAASRRQAEDASKRVADLEDRISDARSSASRTTRTLSRDESQLVRARRDLISANRSVIRDSGDFERAIQRQHMALKRLEDERNRRSGDGRGRHRGGQVSNSLGGIFTSIPFVPGGKAGAVIGSGLVATLGSVADAAVTASQSLWLLPAAAAAGGAAFITLKLGLSGFDKALKDMGDPKKFAQDLAGLAPNAQQAALEIQKLVGGLNGLKTITQNALFKNVAQQLDALGKAFMPEIKQMTTGIAGAFNQIFQSATSQMMDPGTHANLSALINNIVTAFQNLAPAMGPIVDAFSKIAKVGSDFLPGMATAFGNLAQKFAAFIDAAQRSGKLHEWIQKGIDAAATLGHVIGNLAHKIFDVFGNKNPDQFKSTLEGMVGAAIGVAQAIEGISQTVNRLVQDIQPVADALGGWPNLIQDVIAVWAEWKVAQTITSLMRISEILGVTLPASAATGAAGISAALAAVKVPVWLTTLMALWNLHGDSGPGPNIPGGSPMGPNSPQAQGIQAKQNAGQAYAKDHGGQMPQGYMDWLKGGKMPEGMDKYYTAPANPGTPFFDSQGRPLDANGRPFGSGGPPNPTPYNPSMPKSQAPGTAPFKPGETPWDNIPVPGVPGKGGKGKLPKAVSPLDPAFAAPPRPGETEGEYSAEGALMQAKHRKADDEATLQELEKDNNATAEQIQAQKNKIIQDQREINKAELELQDAQDAANKKQLKGVKGITDAMKDIGPQLDEDFGLSKGLPGLAKNLVEFVASLAAAPLLGPLAAISAADPIKGGFGAIGIMGENNIRAGKSPLFGIPPGMPGGPSLGGLGNAAIGSAALPGMGAAGAAGAAGGKAGMAQAIYSSLLQAGYSPQTALTAVAASLHESGLNPDITNPSGHHGLFQESADKPSAGAGQQIQWFLGQLGALGGPGVVDQDPANIIADKVERGGYPGSTYNQYMSQAQGLVGQGGVGRSSYLSGGQGGIQSAGMSMPGGISANPASLASMVPNAPNVEAGIRSMGGLPNGTLYPTSGPGAYQVPSWAQQLAQQFGLTASTYSSGGSLHQMGYAFDFNGPQGNMDAFADYIQKNLASQTLQLIHADGNRRWGIASGRDVSGGGYYAGDYGGHFDHVHWATDVPPIMGGLGQAGMGPSPSMPNAQLTGYSTGTGQGGLGPAPNFPGPPPSPGPGGGVPGFPMPGGPGSAPGPGGGTPGFPMPGGVDEGNPTPQGAPKGGGWQPDGGSGGLGIGGMPAAAITSAAGMFPGGGAAAQLVMKLANRTIQQAGEYAAIGVQGLQETFGVHDPDGGGNGLDDIGNNIFGRVLKGLAKAKPAVPTSAGKTELPKKDQKQGDQGQQGQQIGTQNHGGLHVGGNLNITQAPGQNPQTSVNDLAWMGSSGALTSMMA